MRSEPGERPPLAGITPVGTGVLLAALACTGSAFGGVPEPVGAQEMPRGVTTDLFDAALRDTLDTPPAVLPSSRSLIDLGPAVLLVGTCGLLLVLVRRRRRLAGRGVRVANRPPSEQGAPTSAMELPSLPRGSPRRTKTPVNLPPHVVDLLRRSRQRRLEAQERREPADQEKPSGSGHDVASPPLARQQIDVWIPGYGAGRSNK